MNLYFVYFKGKNEIYAPVYADKYEGFNDIRESTIKFKDSSENIVAEFFQKEVIGIVKQDSK